jgi:hypothetical protein
VMVQEYADGGDLFSLLQKYGGRLSERVTVSLVLEPFLRVLQVQARAASGHRGGGTARGWARGGTGPGVGPGWDRTSRVRQPGGVTVGALPARLLAAFVSSACRAVAV